MALKQSILEFLQKFKNVPTVEKELTLTDEEESVLKDKENDFINTHYIIVEYNGSTIYLNSSLIRMKNGKPHIGGVSYPIVLTYLFSGPIKQGIDFYKPLYYMNSYPEDENKNFHNLRVAITKDNLSFTRTTVSYDFLRLLRILSRYVMERIEADRYENKTIFNHIEVDYVQAIKRFETVISVDLYIMITSNIVMETFQEVGGQLLKDIVYEYQTGN